MLPDEIKLQFKIIRTRIVDKARCTIQGENFDIVAQLTNYLKQIYSLLVECISIAKRIK